MISIYISELSFSKKLKYQYHAPGVNSIRFLKGGFSVYSLNTLTIIRQIDMSMRGLNRRNKL